MVILRKDPRFTYFDTFTFQGKEYKMLTDVKTKQSIYTLIRPTAFMPPFPRMQLVQSYVDHHNKHKWKYAVWRDDGQAVEWITEDSPDEIIDYIIEKSQEKKFHKDTEVDNVVIGWVIYIFIMIFALIFNGRIVIWLFATIYFFYWRNNKLTVRSQIINENESERAT